MKLGTENRTTLYLACGLLLVAVILGGRFIGSLFSGSSSAAAAPGATVTTSPATETLGAQPAARGHGLSNKPVTSRSLDPTLRFDLLKSSEDTNYEGRGRDVFRVFVDIPKVVQSPVRPTPQEVANPGPPASASPTAD